MIMENSEKLWTGKIPDNWKFYKGKYIFGERSERGNSVNLQLLSPTQKFGVIPQSMYDELTSMKSVKVKEDTDLSTFKTIHKGDFCISLRSFQGGFEYSEYEGVVSPAYHVLYPKMDICAGYYKYLFKEQRFIREMNSYCQSLRDGKNISYSDFGRTVIPFPPLSEQQAIADYLDETCSKIDEIIAEAKASIDEYKELKQSVIFEAVTKGLDKNVEMKEIDGWIRWLPKGWNFRKINGLFNVIGSGTTPKSSIEEYYQGTINWLQSGDINGTVVKNTKKHISDEIVENTSALVVYDAPFIAIAMYGASIGNISIVDINACTNQACCVLSQPTKDIDMGYSFWCIMSAKEELLLSSRGGGQPNISQNIIKQLRIPLPPLMEQRKIADYLSDKTKEIDSLIAEKESLINDLEAYKKSLIYEVVTGKRRVV